MQVTAPLACLRAQVDALATAEGRTDASLPGLRYYRFSRPTDYRKTQILVPGIVVVLQGAKTVHLHGRSLRYPEGHCLVLGAAAVCHGTVVEAEPGRPYLAIHLDLPPAMLVKTLLALGPEPRGADGAAHYVAPLEPALLDTFLRLVAASLDPLDRSTLAPLAVEEIVVRLLRSDAAAAVREAAAVTRAAARIQKAIAFIHAELQRPLTVQELAAHVAMSPSHFASSFRAVAGVTPMRYLRDARLAQARDLMVAGGLRAAEAATRTGFDSNAHFTRAFRQRYECTPGEFAQRMRAGPQAS